MDNVSVSKGVFGLKGSYKLGLKKKKRQDVLIEPWSHAYKDCWSIIENAAKEINIDMFKQILLDLQDFVANVKGGIEENILCEISTAILLTGISLPDHGVLFRKLADTFSTITECIAVVHSRDAGNLKSLIEETIFQLLHSSSDKDRPEFRKTQCTFRVLQAYYNEYCYSSMPLVIIIPDFESFNPATLRDFILVLSSYSRSLKFVLVFGVATTLHAVHRSLTYDVTSKLRVQVFHTQTQLKGLSDVLEGTVLSGKTPFMLTGHAFHLLTDIFIFYDFSVRGFLQGYKLCMIQHFYDNNFTSLCCNSEDITERLEELTEEDIKELKELPSIAKYMEKSHLNIENINSQDFKSIIHKLLKEFHDAMSCFFTILKCLHSLTFSLPDAPLGKELREVYANAVTCDIIEMQQYKNCLQVLTFQSKDELLEKLGKILETIKTNESSSLLNDVKNNLEKHIKIIKKASLVATNKETDIDSIDQKLHRIQFLEKLKNIKKSRSPFEQAKLDVLKYLDRNVFAVYLMNPNRLAASEIFCFSDTNATRRHLRGSSRAAIHTGLNNPHAYLNCNCCKLDNNDVIQATLPDLCIIYKLHLESRKIINMYDWLQAFLTIVSPSGETEEEREVDPKMQARFSQAVAELQLLGFIKSSRRKIDHVKRLT